MDILMLITIALGALAGVALFGGDGGGGDGPETPPGEEGASPPGEGGYGPDGTYDLIWGNSEVNDLIGGDNKEVIVGYAGDDTLSGGNGDDRLFGHADNDQLNPGAGDDDVFGGQGNDLVNGGVIDGTFGDADAFMSGLTARMVDDGGLILSNAEHAAAQALGTADVADDQGNDFIRGEDGNDVLADGFGQDTIHGDLGADVIFSVDIADQGGDPTSDQVFGGFGADTIFADDGDVVSGGEGVDRFVIANGLNAKDGGDEDAVTITDFDPATEVLEVENFDGEYGDGTYSLDEQAEGTYVVMNGIDVVLFQGMSAADLAGITVDVTDRAAV